MSKMRLEWIHHCLLLVTSASCVYMPRVQRRQPADLPQ